MSLSLFRRPGSVVFLDDDPSYLDMLALTLPTRWHVDLFLRPRACLDHLLQEPARWETDAWAQQQIINRWREGSPLIPQILRYWTTETQRHDLTRVCVFDYAMPGMNGLQALGELVDWSGARMLLTGQADEQIAIDAFNQGLIDRFIPKQTPDISRRLVDAAQQLLDTPDARHAQTWRATLTPAQHALLREPAVATDLARRVRALFVEHVVVGDPFGILGLDAEGRASWLQLEPVAGLPELAELAASQDVPVAAVADIRAGRQLIDLELQQAVGEGAPARLAPAFAVGGGTLLGALFAVDSPASVCQQRSYAAWLASRGPRVVRD